MPHKVNAARRHHIPKARFKVTNRAEYEAWLHRRGGLMLCIADEAIDAWDAAARARPGGQASCYDSATQTCLMLRTAFMLALRQAEGLMTSVVELLDCELAVPDHTTVSRRTIKLPSIARAALPEGPLHVLIDSPGLQVHGAGEWLAGKHGQRSRRHWHKLHLALDAGNGQIVAVTLTDQDIDDVSRVGPLLKQIPGKTEQLAADGACDGEPTHEAISAQDADIAVDGPHEIQAPFLPFRGCGARPAQAMPQLRHNRPAPPAMSSSHTACTARSVDMRACSWLPAR